MKTIFLPEYRPMKMDGARVMRIRVEGPDVTAYKLEMFNRYLVPLKWTFVYGILDSAIPFLVKRRKYYV